VSVWAVVVAAGGGQRFDALRLKQHEMVGSWRVQDLSMRAARSAAAGVVLVTRKEFADEPEPLADRVVAGGDSRSASVRCGLDALPADCDIVVVHDAARPLASAELFAAVVGAVRAGADAAIPGVAVSDTIKRVADGQVAETIDRDDLVAVQTPQAFRLGALRAAHAGEPEATDDAALVELAGGRVVVVAGEPANLKITTQDDLAVVAMRIR
jgi:2-C-methyl-D-erythritol 4-phosphate cytidylyltransferase